MKLDEAIETCPRQAVGNALAIAVQMKPKRIFTRWSGVKKGIDPLETRYFN